MTSLILSAATRFLLPLLLLFSIFALVRGHNSPGGGFVGGLVAATAISLYVIAYDVPAARRLMMVAPQTVIGGGLLIATAGGTWALLHGQSLMTAQWVTIRLPAGQFQLGTPLLFDCGVYLVVVGVITLIVFSLAEE